MYRDRGYSHNRPPRERHRYPHEIFADTLKQFQPDPGVTIEDPVPQVPFKDRVHGILRKDGAIAEPFSLSGVVLGELQYGTRVGITTRDAFYGTNVLVVSVGGAPKTNPEGNVKISLEREKKTEDEEAKPALETPRHTLNVSSIVPNTEPLVLPIIYGKVRIGTKQVGQIEGNLDGVLLVVVRPGADGKKNVARISIVELPSKWKIKLLTPQRTLGEEPPVSPPPPTPDNEKKPIYSYRDEQLKKEEKALIELIKTDPTVVFKQLRQRYGTLPSHQGGVVGTPVGTLTGAMYNRDTMTRSSVDIHFSNDQVRMMFHISNQGIHEFVVVHAASQDDTNRNRLKKALSHADLQGSRLIITTKLVEGELQIKAQGYSYDRSLKTHVKNTPELPISPEIFSLVALGIETPSSPNYSSYY